MTLPSPRRHATAALSVAALVGAALAPALAAPATATPALAAPAAARAAAMHAAAPAPAAAPAERALATTPACRAPLPYGAAAHADLLRLDLLNLRPLGLELGPVAGVRIGEASAGMAADEEVASAAAARDVDANLLGLDLIGLVSAGELGRTVHQQAPPTNAVPAADTGLPVDLGVARLDVGGISAHATWDEAMRCGAVAGEAAVAEATLADAAVLPTPAGGGLVRLPHNLASHAEVGLAPAETGPAARATASISVTDLRIFSGPAKIKVKVIGPPTLEAVATGERDSSSVRYQAPVLEITGPGFSHRLDTPEAYLDLALPTAGAAVTAPPEGVPLLPGDPLADLLRGVDPGLGQIITGSEDGAGRLDLAGAPRLPGIGPLAEGGLAHLGGLSVLRLSLGQLRQEITDQSVSAAAASLRLQVLAADATGYGDRVTESAVLDLGIGLLEVGAEAPEPEPARPPYAETTPSAPSDGHACGGCPSGGGEEEDGDPEEGLPVTGPTAGILVGAGILLAIAGRFLLLLSRRGSYVAG